jgi:hypothetical protein
MLTHVGSGFEMSVTEQLPASARPVGGEVDAVVVDLDDLVATLEMGPEAEEWVFPRSMLPADIEVDSVLTFDGRGSAATVVAHRLPGPSVEDRMARAITRRVPTR